MRGLRGRSTLVLVAACAALALSACGEDEEPRLDAGPLLDRAFETPVPSAVADIDAELELEGVPELPEPVRVTLGGPYDAGDMTKVPSLDWDGRVDLGGFGVGGELVSSGDNVFVRVLGATYEVGAAPIAQLNKRVGISTREAGGRPRPLAALGLHPREWIGDPEHVGDEEVEGVETHVIEAEIEIPRLDPGELELWVGAEDGIVRRLRLELDTGIPFERRDELLGANRLEATIELVLAEVGGPQSVAEPPGPYLPISELRRRIASVAGISG